jgi:hypothetical protein
MRIVCFFVLIAVIIACQTKERPKEVLSQTQLSALLVDVYLAEARTEMIPKVKDSSIRYFIPFEQKLLKEKGIPDSVLKITYAYYMANPKELELIYDSVIDTLVVREQRVNRTNPTVPAKMKAVK